MENIKMSAPSYIYKGANTTAVIPLDSELLGERMILIDDTITSQTAVDFYKSVRYLAKSDEPIKVILSSGGGEVIAGQAIYDIMQGVKNEVHTYCLGRAASMAAVLLAAGTKGHRYILPHSEVMIHEVLIGRGVGGSATSISKISESINKTRDVMNGILAKHTGKTIEEINEATSFDNYMTAEQAVEFGICDKIITNIFEEE
ncbi:ATP-dependent Clp protease, protease subunit [Ruminococcaceae bacterium FB2012]|nr:ATP-dependent Clp protease, protease subunit [Ruminococcaceae bacterium FB2012]